MSMHPDDMLTLAIVEANEATKRVAIQADQLWSQSYDRISWKESVYPILKADVVHEVEEFEKSIDLWKAAQRKLCEAIIGRNKQLPDTLKQKETVG